MSAVKNGYELAGANIRNFVHKLDHNQEEVRLRALDNIINKLSYGIVSTVDLACDRVLIAKLLQWFQQPTVLKQMECLDLILKICSEDVGCQTVFSLGGHQFLQSLKADVTLECQMTIDRIVEQLYIKCSTVDPEAYPNQLKYERAAEQRQRKQSQHVEGQRRDGQAFSDVTQHANDTGNRYHNGSSYADVTVSAQSRISTAGAKTSLEISNESRRPEWYSQPERLSSDTSNGAGFLVVEFPWITLCSTDVHVLESTNQSLVSQDPQLILSACEFLVDVMLFDFPAEIFLQRPLIIKTLIKLLSSQTDCYKVSDVALSLVDALIQICDGVKARVRFHKDPATFAPKQDILALNPLSKPHVSGGSRSGESGSNSSSGSHSQHSRPSVVGISDELDEDKTQSTSLASDGHRSKSSYRSVSVQMTSPNIEELELQDLQLLLPDFCLSLHRAALILVEKCNNRLELELLRLLLKLQNMLTLSITSSIWSDNSQYAKELCETLRQQLNSLARVGVKFQQMANSAYAGQELNPATGHRRLSFILLSQLHLHLCTLVPDTQYADVLGSNDRQLLYTLCCDESLAQSLPTVRQRAADILERVDVGSYELYKSARVICGSMDMCCRFLLSSNSTQGPTETLKMISQADKAIYSIPYHMNTDLVAAYVKLCSVCYRMREGDDEEVNDYMIKTLLKYMAHPLLAIRKETYQHIIALLKSCLSFDKPSQSSSDSILFLTHHSLLWEVACFGLPSEIPEIMSYSQDLFNYLMQCRMLVPASLWTTVCKSLLPILPILQSYASPDLTLGKCILAFTDTHFDLNISRVHCVKGALRMLFTRNSPARLHAAKVLMTELNSVYSSHLLYPLTETKRYEDHIIYMETLVREHDADSSQRSVLNEESVTRVMRVFLSDRVETGVRLTSLNQLAVILQNPHTQKYFLDQKGLEITLKTISNNIVPEMSAEEEEAIPPAVSILASLLQHNSDLRQTLAADVISMLTLLRCCWLFPHSTRTSVEAAQCLTYIIFDEVSPKCSSTILSLPKTCCVRYKLPLRVLSYCDISTHRVDAPPSSNDPITQIIPLQMLRVYWNIAWHGKVEFLLDSIDREQVNSGSERLTLSAADICSLKESNTLYAIFASLRTVTNATSHNVVAQELGTLTGYSLVCALGTDHRDIATITWSTYFQRYLRVEPVAPVDKELLIRILGYFTTLVNLGMPTVTSNVLGHLCSSLQAKDSALLSLLQDSAYSEPTDTQYKRSIQNSLLTILGAAGLLRDPPSPTESVDKPRHSYLVRGVLKRLTMADASNFYNLASLESSVYTLLRLTSRCGWSFGCAELDSGSLCSQLIKALFEVLSAFHLGRQGNSLSYMGKGVLRNATLCLRHVVDEIATVAQQNDSWLSPWIDGSEGETRLEWIRSLWRYRDQEVRAAALGVSVALVHTSLELDSIFSSVTEMIRDAAIVVIDSTECSLVRRQAAILISNLVHSIYQHGLQQSDYSGKKQLVAVCEVLDSLDYFNEIFTILSTDIFIHTDLNIDSLHRQIRPELGDSVCNVVYPTLATPALLSSIMQGLTLLTKALPANVLHSLQQADVIQHLISFFRNSSVVTSMLADPDTLDQSSVLLKRDVIGLCADIISLLRSCVIQNTYLRNKTLSTSAIDHVNNILAALPTENTEDKTIRRVLVTCWNEIFQYLAAHLHIESGDLALEGLVLPNVIKYWARFTAITLHVLKVEDEGCRVSVLEFWTIVLGLLYRHKQEHAIKDLLDKPGDDVEAFGCTLYRCLLPLYDSMLLRYADKECIQERLIVINCLKNLLAMSQAAKSAALKDGLVESLLSHLNGFIGKLNLLATHKLGALNESNGCFAELVVSLELVTNFLLRDDEVKLAMSEVGLANLIHRMWFYCESDSQLMTTCISALISYTENSALACRHMVCTSTVSCLGMDTDRLQIQSNSLADILVKQTVNQLNKMHLNIGLLTQLFNLMCNFALSADSLSAICKSTLANGFASCNPKVTIKRKPKLQTALTKLWIQLFLNLSYAVEGQKLIMAVPDCVGIMVDQLTASEDGVKEMILIVLYNLCVGFRSKILTNECVPLTALSILEDSTSSQATTECAIKILQAIIYDSMKGKALIKGLSIPERLAELVDGYRQEQWGSRRLQPDREPLIQSVQQILVTIRE